ncbi:hypothetical protein EJB05_50881, partial [Eragrostis curvula]
MRETFAPWRTRVVGELWDFFRVEPEWRDRAVRRAYDACPKLITDMHYEARVQAVRTYYAKKLGRKIEKKAARTIWLAAEQYMQVIPWWCASHRDCWEYFVSRWCDPEWQKTHEACRQRRLKMPGPAHHQGNRTLDEYATRWSRAHEGRECPPLMAWAMAHKGKATSIEVDYNPEDPPEAYSNPTVHTRLSQYTEMGREKHGPEWNPSTEDLDGEIIMRAQLREEMEAKLQAQEAKYQAQLMEQQARYDARLQEQQAKMQEDLQRQMQFMFHQWHSGGMQPPPLPLPPVGTSSPSQGTPNISAGSNNQPVSPPAAWSPFPPYPRPPPM